MLYLLANISILHRALTIALLPVGTFSLVLAIASACVLGRAVRSPRLGWLALSAGLLVVVTCTVFVSLTLPAVGASWTAHGSTNADSVTLNLGWLLNLVVGVTVLCNTRRTMQYLFESYHSDANPQILRPLRKWALSHRNNYAATKA